MRAFTHALVLSVVVVALGSIGLAGQSKKQIVHPPPGQTPPYSMAINAGGAVYAAGMLPLDAKGVLVQGDITVQTKQAFDNARAALEQAGSSMDQAVHVTLMLQNASDFATVEPLYKAQFKGEPPARTTIIGEMVRPGALIEVQVTAVPNGAERKVILPAGWVKPTSPYNYGIQSGDTLWLAGVVSRNGKDNSMVQGDIKAQTKVAMDNAGEILKAAGMGYGDLVQGRVAIRDMTVWEDMNSVYRTYWEKDRPARVSGQAAPPGTFDVEITFVAIKGNTPREVIVPMTADGKPGTIGPNYSPAIRVGNRLFVSGSSGVTDANHGDMKLQAAETLTRLGRSLKAAGFEYKDVVASDCYIRDVAKFGDFNAGYSPTFPTDPPVRATIGVGGLANKEALIEMAWTAVK